MTQPSDDARREALVERLSVAHEIESRRTRTTMDEISVPIDGQLVLDEYWERIGSARQAAAPIPEDAMQQVLDAVDEALKTGLWQDIDTGLMHYALSFLADGACELGWDHERYGWCHRVLPVLRRADDLFQTTWAAHSHAYVALEVSGPEDCEEGLEAFLRMHTIAEEEQDPVDAYHGFVFTKETIRSDKVSLGNRRKPLEIASQIFERRLQLWERLPTEEAELSRSQAEHDAHLLQSARERLAQLPDEEEALDFRPLHELALAGYADTLQLLIADGLNVNAVDHECSALLHYARTAEVVEVLVAAGADVNAADNEGEKPLNIAALNGWPDAVRALIQAGADVNCSNNKLSTPLHQAVAMDNAEIAQQLIDAGADVDAKDQHDAAPVHYAAVWQRPDIIPILAEAGADVNIEGQGETALEIAHKKDDRATVAALLEAGATPPEDRSQKSEGACFIATACYGSYDHPDVLVFRRFRDEVLLPRSLGEAFVSCYYSIGPSLAQILDRLPTVSNYLREHVLSPLAQVLRD